MKDVAINCMDSVLVVKFENFKGEERIPKADFFSMTLYT